MNWYRHPKPNLGCLHLQDQFVSLVWSFSLPDDIPEESNEWFHSVLYKFIAKMK